MMNQAWGSGGSVARSLANTPRSAKTMSTCKFQIQKSRTHSRIAVRYNAAGATMIDFGGSMP